MATNTQKKSAVPQTPDKVVHMKRGRKPPPVHETKYEKFIRIGQPRVVQAIKDIHLIGNLARGDYQWTKADIVRIERALYGAVDQMVTQFNGRMKPEAHFDFEGADQGLVVSGTK